MKGTKCFSSTVSTLFTAILLNRSSLSQKCVLFCTNELMRMPYSASAYITNANAACYHEIGNCRYLFCGVPQLIWWNICEAFLLCSIFINLGGCVAPIYGLQSSKHRKLAIKLNRKWSTTLNDQRKMHCLCMFIVRWLAVMTIRSDLQFKCSVKTARTAISKSPFVGLITIVARHFTTRNALYTYSTYVSHSYPIQVIWYNILKLTHGFFCTLHS